jgi:hypothetical protein
MKRLRQTRKHGKTTLIDRVATGEEYVLLHTQGTKKEGKTKEVLGKAF